MKIGIKQLDERDCGAACLASVAAYYKLSVPISRIRTLAFTDKQGTSFLGMVKAANQLGFLAKGVRAKFDSLNCVPLPCIAHIIKRFDDKELHHYVVVLKIRKKYIYIMDPEFGRTERINISDFIEQWSENLILLEPDDNFQEGNFRNSFWMRIYILMKPHKRMLLQALWGSVIYTILGLSMSIYIEKITDFVLSGGNNRLLNLLSIIMLFIVLFQVLIGVLQKMLIIRTGQLIDTNLILLYYKHLIRLPQSFFDTMQVGELTSRLGDAIKIRSFISDISINLVTNILILVFSFVLMFTYNYRLALILLLIIPFYMGIYLIVNIRNRKIERKVMERASSLECQLVESISGIKTVKQFGIENYQELKTENRFIKMMYSIYSGGKTGVFAGTSSEVLSRLFTIVTLWVGSYYVIEGEISIGGLMSFYALIGYFTSPITQLLSANQSVQNAMIASERLFDIIDMEIENVHEQSKKVYKNENELIGNIVFENVDFSYGVRKNVLTDFSLVLNIGSISAIVGESGSGKSTIASLIQGLYTIKSGKIKIGELDLKYLDKQFLRRSISCVPQQITLFSGSIIDNIALGEEEPDMKRIIKISERLGITSFIEELPKGFNTQVGENGSLLSGGQKQRIAIARALYLNPDIYIFDEATSSLDVITEQLVQDVIQELKEDGKTIIIITHRLSIVRQVDKIFVLNNGKLIEQGTFSELESSSIYFSKLLRNQSYINE